MKPAFFTLSSRSMIKMGAALVLIITLSACSIRSHHHFGHRASSGVHIHGHVHGKPSRVVGALVAGAIIGHVINEAIVRKERHPDYRNSDYDDQRWPESDYYLEALDGSCYWVTRDDDGNERRNAVASKHCRGDDD